MAKTKVIQSIEVFACGCPVRVGGSIDAVITGISVRFGRVSYEVSYFLHGEYKTVWLDGSEFTVSNKANNNKVKLGFK